MHGIMSPQSEPSPAGGNPAEAGDDIKDEFEARLLAEQKRHHEEFRQFAYAVSHDLREPIRMIVSYTQLLDRRYQGKLDSDGTDFMRYILEATQRMDRLLGDLLTYSHQFRPLDQPLELVEPEGALQGAVLMLDAAVRESGAQVTNDSLPSILFDFAQLTHLFRQLLSNAMCFRGPQPPRSMFRPSTPAMRFNSPFETTVSASTSVIMSRSLASSSGCMAASSPAPALVWRFANELSSSAADESGWNLNWGTAPHFISRFRTTPAA